MTITRRNLFAALVGAPIAAALPVLKPVTVNAAPGIPALRTPWANYRRELEAYRKAAEQWKNVEPIKCTFTFENGSVSLPKPVGLLNAMTGQSPV